MVDTKPTTLWAVVSFVCSILGWVGALTLLLGEAGPGAYLAGAAGGALAAVVFAALRPSAGYYRLRPFEASGEFYARLGVRFFRRFVVQGDYFNRLARRTNPDYRSVRSSADVPSAERLGRLNERVHVTILVLLLPPTCWALVCGQYGLAAWLILVNGLCNLYPALLQRYTRARLHALARRVRKRGPEKVAGTNGTSWVRKRWVRKRWQEPIS